MNTLKLEVVRFDNEDVIATSYGTFFTLSSEWEQFDGYKYSTPYVRFSRYPSVGYSSEGMDETDIYTPYAWYHDTLGEWETAGKTASEYDKGGWYDFPKGIDN